MSQENMEQIKLLNIRLLDYCRWNETQLAIEFLKNNPGLDVLQHDGVCIKLSVKNSNTELLGELLKHYHQTKLNDTKCLEYKQNLCYIDNILCDVEATYDLSADMEKLFDNYRIKDTNAKLLDYCSWNETNKAIDILDNNLDLDLTQENGIYIKLSVKNNNSVLLKELLKYYKRTKLNNPYSPEYKQNAIRINEILHDINRTYHTTTKRVDKILKKYYVQDADGSKQ